MLLTIPERFVYIIPLNPLNITSDFHLWGNQGGRIAGLQLQRWDEQRNLQYWNFNSLAK